MPFPSLSQLKSRPKGSQAMKAKPLVLLTDLPIYNSHGVQNERKSSTDFSMPSKLSSALDKLYVIFFKTKDEIYKGWKK